MNFYDSHTSFKYWVLGLRTFGDDKFLQNTQKMWLYVANHGQTFRVYYEIFQKA